MNDKVKTNNIRATIKAKGTSQRRIGQQVIKRHRGETKEEYMLRVDTVMCRLCGTLRPDPDLVNKVAQALECSVDTLIEKL